jgi:hypothetical protein
MLHKLLPQINLRLMLLRPENRQVAANIGLPVFMVGHPRRALTPPDP